MPGIPAHGLVTPVMLRSSRSPRNDSAVGGFRFLAPPVAGGRLTGTRKGRGERHELVFLASVAVGAAGRGSNAVPANRWRRRPSVSQDEDPGAAGAVLVAVQHGARTWIVTRGSLAAPASLLPC